MKKFLGILFILIFAISSLNVSAADFNLDDYTYEIGTGFDVNFNEDFSKILNIGSVGSAGVMETNVVDISEDLSTPDYASYGNALKMSVSGKFDTAPYLGTAQKPLTLKETKNKIMMLSMDVALSDPTKGLYFMSVRAYTDENDEAKSDWVSGYTQFEIQKGTGKLRAAGEFVKNTGGSDMVIEPNVMHNYKVILDIPAKMSYHFVDGRCVKSTDMSKTGIVGFMRHNSTTANEFDKTEYYYFDNVAVRALVLPNTASLDIGGAALTEVPYDLSELKLSFSQAVSDKSLSSVSLKTKDGADVSFTPSISSDAKTLTLGSVELLPNTEYVLDISDILTGDNVPLKEDCKVFNLKTCKLPFSLRSAEYEDGTLTVTVNNRTQESKTAFFMAGIYDGNEQVSYKASSVHVTSDGQSFTLPITKTGAIELYMIDPDSFNLIEKMIID